MKNNYLDREFQNYIYDILENEEFKKMENIVHHETNRLDHSVRVSYYSYKVAKFFRFDSEKVARASLLHDFFLEKYRDLKGKKKVAAIFKHPEYALSNAKEYFDLSPLEEDIIVSHMFPLGTHIPKYLESWIVDIVDDVVSIYEKTTVIGKQLSTATYFLVILLINNLR